MLYLKQPSIECWQIYAELFFYISKIERVEKIFIVKSLNQYILDETQQSSMIVFATGKQIITAIEPEWINKSKTLKTLSRYMLLTLLPSATNRILHGLLSFSMMLGLTRP